jgi:hypothetical protein
MGEIITSCLAWIDALIRLLLWCPEQTYQDREGHPGAPTTQTRRYTNSLLVSWFILTPQCLLLCKGQLYSSQVCSHWRLLSRIECRYSAWQIQVSAACFLIATIISQCSYEIDCAYCDNDITAQRYADAEQHALVRLASSTVSVRNLPMLIDLKPMGRSNALSVLSLEEWHNQYSFRNTQYRHLELMCFAKLA